MRTYTVEIEQAKIDAPAFPREETWWRRFVPAWVDVESVDNDTVRLAVDSQPRAKALDRWVTTGAAGRLAAAVRRTG